jgi:hypothetical protein
MPILKPVTAPNGSLLAFHRVQRSSIDFDSLKMSVFVSSWVDSDDYLGWNIPTWMWCVQLDPDMNNLDVDTALSQSGVFAGGTVVNDPRLDLASLKEYRWARIKAVRAVKLQEPLVTPWGTFDADPDSQNNIVRSVILLGALESSFGPGSTVDYTLYDNTVVSMDLSSMTSVGLMLGAREGAVRAIATGLRSQIDACETIEELNMEWPTE